MRKLFFLCSLLLLFFIASADKIFAASLTISNFPATLDQSQEFSADVSLSCSGCSDSYLRGVFYPSGTSYFGYTKDNNGSFSNAPGSNCTTFFKVAQTDLLSGSWSGTLKFKPDTTSPYYNGPGEYAFKVGRYTSSCSSPSVWSQEITIAITGPSPTPTSAPTSASSQSTSTNSTSTRTPTPSPTKIPTITPKVSLTVSKTNNSDKIASDFARVINQSPEVTEPPATVAVLGARDHDFSLILPVLVGFILLIIAIGFMTYKNLDQIKAWIIKE